MKVWVVPYVYGGGLIRVEVFGSYEKAKFFVEDLKREHGFDKKREGFDFFIREKEVK